MMVRDSAGNPPASLGPLLAPRIPNTNTSLCTHRSNAAPAVRPGASRRSNRVLYGCNTDKRRTACVPLPPVVCSDGNETRNRVRGFRLAHGTERPVTGVTAGHLDGGKRLFLPNGTEERTAVRRSPVAKPSKDGD